MEQHFPHRALFSESAHDDAALPVQQYVPHPTSSALQRPYQSTPAANLAPYYAAYPYPTPYPYPVPNAYRTPVSTSPSPAYPTYAFPISPQVPYQVVPAPYSTVFPPSPQLSHPHHSYISPAYPSPPYSPFPYPQTILPPPKAPELDRENEIYSRGYKESPDYPRTQARKERRIARIVFFSAIALLLVFFLTPFMNVVIPEDISELTAILATFAFEIVLIVVFSLLLRHAFPQKSKDALGLKKPCGIYVLIGIGSAFGALIVGVTSAIIVMLLSGDITENPQAERYAEIPQWQLLIILLVCVPILAPLFEELLFRGILVGSAVRAFPGKAGFFIAIIATGLVFGSLHFPGTFDIIGIYVVIFISCVGMFFAWLRLKTNSTLVTMTTHAFYNGSLVALQLAAGLSGAPDMFALL